MSGRACTVRAITAVVAAGALAGLGAAWPAAADIVDDGMPGLLTIDAQPLELDIDLAPGDAGDWLITARLDAPGPGSFDLRVTSSGRLVETPDGLLLGVDECPAPWTPAVAPGGRPSCPGTSSVLLAPTPFAELSPGDIVDLGTLEAQGERWLRVTVSMPDPAPASLQGGDAVFSLGFASAGELVVVDGRESGDRIARTGIGVTVPLALAAALGLLGVGLRLGARGRR